LATNRACIAGKLKRGRESKGGGDFEEKAKNERNTLGVARSLLSITLHHEGKRAQLNNRERGKNGKRNEDARLLMSIRGCSGGRGHKRKKKNQRRKNKKAGRESKIQNTRK